MKLRDYQVKLHDEIYAAWAAGHRNVLAVMPTGAGKCLGRGTPILMYDGTIKPVEDVRVGDMLMGPDSTPRGVISTCCGQEMLYRVTPVKGDPYVVNESHILSLKRTGDKRGEKGAVVNVEVRDYLLRTKGFKHVHKGWRAPVAAFGVETCDPPLPPYVLGVWLGDGNSRSPEICNVDHEVIAEWCAYAESIGHRIAISDEHKVPIYRIKGPADAAVGRGHRGNKVRSALTDMGLLLNKHIPHVYKTASWQQRLELLAGIVDTDGYLGNGHYDVVVKQEQFAKDIVFVARSLGLAAYIKPCEKQCTTAGAWGNYWRLSISGDIDKIPCRVARRKAQPRQQKKDVLVTGVSVEPIGVGDYFGFEVCGTDRLFMLGDFTVTHNTVTFAHVVSEQQGAVIVLAHRAELVAQISLALAREGVRHRVVGPKNLIKLCVQGHMGELRRSFYDATARVGVASVQSLGGYKDHDGWLHQVQLWVHDECFPAGTLVDGRPIETLRVGDTVTAFDERTGIFAPRRVVRVFKNPAPKQMVRLTAGHHQLQCTLNHPIYTRRGWVPAGLIGEGDEILGTIRSGDLHDMRDEDGSVRVQAAPVRAAGCFLLLERMSKHQDVGGVIGNDGPHKPQVCVKANDRTQSDAACGCAGESVEDAACDQAFSQDSRWEWSATDCGRGRVVQPFRLHGVSDAICGANCRPQYAERSDAATLQDRLRASNHDDCTGGGWQQPFCKGTSSAGRAEGPLFAWTRVERVEIQESTNTGRPKQCGDDGHVYNLEVEDWHTYVANGVVVHNCHHLLADNQFGKAVARLPNARGLGVTATPSRTDGKGLGRRSHGLMDTMILGPQPRELIRRGFLSRYKIFAPPNDFHREEVKITASGEFNPQALKEATKKSRVLGDVVDHYVKHANGKLGLTFADSIENATDIARRYRAAGVAAEVLTGDTDDFVRAQVLQRFRNRQVMQIVSVALIDEGFDCPGVEVVSDAAATESLGRYLQRFGRGLRVMEGKTHMLYFDHVGNVQRHGLPDKERAWSLEPRERRGSKKSGDDTIPLRTCVECAGVYERILTVCPYCGAAHEPAGRSSPEQVDGDLQELDTAALEALWGEVARVDGPCYPPQHLDAIARRAVQNRHHERQVAQKALREVMDLWAGWKGQDLSACYKLFYWKYGMDVATAMALGAREAEELRQRICDELDENGVVGI